MVNILVGKLPRGWGGINRLLFPKKEKNRAKMRPTTREKMCYCTIFPDNSPLRDVFVYQKVRFHRCCRWGINKRIFKIFSIGSVNTDLGRKGKITSASISNFAPS